MRRLVALIATLLCALAFPAAATEYGYVIAEGDLLGIAVWGVKELTFQSKVRLDGKITVPGVGEVDAAGMTPAKLQAQLARDLMPLVKAPLVTVEVKESAKNSVFLFGSGAPTHSYQLDRRTSLLQLLSALPDLKNVDFKRAYLVREGKKLDIDIYRLFILGDPDQDQLVMAGDTLFLPAMQERKIYVLGAVKAAKTIEYREGLKVMDAILEAGGFSKYADQNAVTVRRKNGAETSSFTVKAKRIVKDGDLSQNLELQSGDYVLVPEGFL